MRRWRYFRRGFRGWCRRYFERRFRGRLRRRFGRLRHRFRRRRGRGRFLCHRRVAGEASHCQHDRDTAAH
jgi:hypothetical protein